jgi:hypothetical protein
VVRTEIRNNAKIVLGRCLPIVLAACIIGSNYKLTFSLIQKILAKSKKSELVSDKPNYFGHLQSLIYNKPL